MNKGILRFSFMVLGLLAISYLAVTLSSRQQAKTSQSAKIGPQKDTTYHKLVDDSTIYHFYNTALLPPNYAHLSCENVLERKFFYPLDDEEHMLVALDTELSQKGIASFLSDEDRDFIIKQFQNGVWFILDPKQIKGKKVIPVGFTLGSRPQLEEFMDKVKQHYRCVDMVSVPYFNLDKTIALVSIYSGFGRMGSSGVYVYTLNKAKQWEFYLMFNHIEA